MTEEAKAIARKMIQAQPSQADDIVIGGEVFITDPIDPPKQYHKETKEAWNSLMKLYVAHGVLNQRELPLFRIMFDNLDFYYTATETIDNVTAGKEGKGRPADIYGGLKETIAARDTFARNFQDYAAIFDKKKVEAVTEDDLRERAILESDWRAFVEEYDKEGWEAYKAWYARYNGYAVDD